MFVASFSVFVYLAASGNYFSYDIGSEYLTVTFYLCLDLVK